jgi:DNA-binding transcriptional ArsR family regulator
VAGPGVIPWVCVDSLSRVPGERKGQEMARGKSHKSKASNLPALVDLRLVRALDHILRQHILLAAVQGEVSPSGLSKALGEGLSQVSYHTKVLRDDCDGMIERTRTVPRRGAVENYYRASEKTLLPAKAWRRLKKGLRAVVGAGQASDLFNDLAGALKAGKLQGAHDQIVRTPLVLDAEGKRNLKAIAERAVAEVEDEQQAAAKRMEKADGGKAYGYTFALLAFEAAWDPAGRA